MWRSRAWVTSGLLAAAVTATLFQAAPPGAATPQERHPGASDHPRGAPTGAKSGLADPHLAGIVDRLAHGLAVDADQARVVGGLVRVEVLGAGQSRLRSAVRGVGGRVVNGVGSLVLADVPVGRLESLERRGDVSLVRTPQRVDAPPEAEVPAPLVLDGLAGLRSVLKTGSSGAEPAQKTGVTAWHAAGFTGQGVKVGIIDYFNQAAWDAAAAEIPGGAAGTICLANGAPCPILGSSEIHGVAVAEVVKDLAPSAAIYLATVSTTSDYQQAIDYFASQGVRIITRSLGSKYDGPGDGTGVLAQLQAYAVGKGMAWFNSAGNSAGATSGTGGYFRSGFVDTDADNWMNFPDGSEYLPFRCDFVHGLRWSDWAGAATDYDIYFYEDTASPPNAMGAADQSAGAPPLETSFVNPANTSQLVAPCSGTDIDYIAIHDFQANNGTAGDVLEIQVGSAIGFSSNPYSATQPAADTRTPGTASIGAVDPWNGVAIASYSSQGPTNDGRTKPDFSAASGFSSKTYGTFHGTSASTPVVAGTAAVVLSASPAVTPSQLVDALRSAVADRGTAGPDNQFGTGELTLPGPPTAPPATAGGVSVTAAAVLPVLNKLKANFPVQVRWKTSGTQTSAAVWRQLNGGDFTQGAAVGSKHRVRTKMVLGKGNRYAIRAADPAGALSDWFYTRVYKPRVIDDRDRKVSYAPGWRHLRVRGAHHGTLSSSEGARGSARLKFKGSSVSLAVMRSANSGKIRVYLDGKPKVKLDLHSKKVEARVVLSYAFASRGRHTIEIEPLTGGRKGLVFIDGFLVLG